MHLDHSRIAAKRCHYNTGDYMTLAELGMAFWHDLAAPVIAGILASMIVSWLNKRK
ncbi:small toxic polypeptide ldrD [Escherichia coli]|nr:small toxic polypeptide ldrD [Escherichia coli]OOJ95483.1 small toxic polypeptide ldrD [Escherichia coli]OOK03099.1 small toxic polypeptide ldrD [Escherichia coli]OOK22338.1 small toxic polypeptide ldrD [Escherichia coli]